MPAFLMFFISTCLHIATIEAQVDRSAMKKKIESQPVASTALLVNRINFAAFHDLSLLQFEKEFSPSNGLLSKGYRLTSLSIYRNSGNLDVKYACVWTKNNNISEWRSCHNISAQAYQIFFDQQVKEGFHPTIITATGGGEVGNRQSNPIVFAAVFEKGNVPFQARHNINGDEFMKMCTWAKANGYYLRWASIYGGRDRLYAGIWEQSGTQWDYSIFTAIDSPIPIPMTKGNLKINFLTKNPFGEYLAVYTNNNYDIKECHALDSGGYQNAFNGFNSGKYIPIVVQVAGDSRQSVLSTNYMGLFRKY